jgi:hypothetical protein
MRTATPESSTSSKSTSRFAHATADAEMFFEPSNEARRLLRWFSPLTTPSDGRGALPWRILRSFLVAPFTQLTFVSFDLQMFLFDVFHTSKGSRAGHLIGMAGVNLFAMAFAVRWSGSLGGGIVYAALLLAWYGAVARAGRVYLWWFVMILVLSALVAGAVCLAPLDARVLVAGFVLSGAMISCSHAFEPLFPPRAGDPLRWMSVREYIFGASGARTSTPVAIARAARVGSYAIIGFFDEVWAAPRLLPYNVLRLMMAAGYARELRDVLDERARRAWASGNPALDYVGIGGGSFLAPPSQAS